MRSASQWMRASGALVLVCVILAGCLPPVAWMRQFGTAGDDTAHGVAANGLDGASYVVGSATAAFEGQQARGGLDAYVRKYSSAGNILWTRQFGTTANDSASAVAIVADGVVVAGSTLGTLANQSSAGETDAFVRKYSPAGNVMWTSQFGTASNEAASGVIVDRSGNVIVVGDTSGLFPGQNGGFSFARKLDPQGRHVWTRQFIDALSRPSDVAVDGLGNIYIVGSAEGPGGTLEAYLRAYSPGGDLRWSKQGSGQVGTTGSFGRGVIVNTSGVVFMVGTTFHPLTMDPVGSDAYGQAFAAADGRHLWSVQVNATKLGQDAGTDSSGYFYMAGGMREGDPFVRRYSPLGQFDDASVIDSPSNDSPALGVAVDSTGRVWFAGTGVLPKQPSFGGTDAFIVHLAPVNLAT